MAGVVMGVAAGLAAAVVLETASRSRARSNQLARTSSNRRDGADFAAAITGSLAALRAVLTKEDAS